jgi:hypothetical protein
MPTKELERIPILNVVTINGLSIEIALSKAAKEASKEASTSDRVAISCKCKKKCNTKRCRCFKE